MSKTGLDPKTERSRIQISDTKSPNQGNPAASLDCFIQWVFENRRLKTQKANKIRTGTNLDFDFKLDHFQKTIIIKLSTLVQILDFLGVQNLV